MRSPACSTVTESRGATPPPTVTVTTIPSSSIQTTPSITGRSASTYVLGATGALTLNEKVAVSPGATEASLYQITSSFLIPRFACCPSAPFTHGFDPVFRKVTVIGALVSPGARTGFALWLTSLL